MSRSIPTGEIVSYKVSDKRRPAIRQWNPTREDLGVGAKMLSPTRPHEPSPRCTPASNPRGQRRRRVRLSIPGEGSCRSRHLYNPAMPGLHGAGDEGVFLAGRLRIRRIMPRAEAGGFDISGILGVANRIVERTRANSWAGYTFFQAPGSIALYLISGVVRIPQASWAGLGCHWHGTVTCRRKLTAHSE